MALSFICLQPLLLNLRSLTQPRASASTPFSEIRWHQDTLISMRFCGNNPDKVCLFRMVLFK